MGLLDFKPEDHGIPKRFKGRVIRKVSEEERQSELNNVGRKKVSEDFSDSEHLNN